VPEDEQEIILTLDVGGHHISAGRFYLCGETLGETGHVLVPSGGTAVGFLDALEAICREVQSRGNEKPAAVSGLAMAMPNPFDYERGVSHMRHKFQELYGVELRPPLSRRLGLDPGSIHFLNDAAAYLLGELHQGAASGVRRAVVITLGTGIGSAFAVDGRIVVDGCGVPPGGEIWNLPYGGGTIEDFAGTRAIQRLHLERTGVNAQVHEIAAAAADDAVARETFEQFGRELGRLLRFTTAEFCPQRIVIGGGISRSSALFFPAAQAELAGLGIELRVALLGDRAPLIGAAMSWMDRESPARELMTTAHAHDSNA